MRRSVCAIGLLAAALGGCSAPAGVNVPGGTPAAQSLAVQHSQLNFREPKYQVLYSFKGAPDGANPEMGLTAVEGGLYGTTFNGGTHVSGTVFRITLEGRERVLYSFKGGSDGANPYARLTRFDGGLYGTTTGGGGTSCQVGGGYGYGSGCGTVFELSKSGGYRIVYRFQGGQDGSTPQVDLVPLDGELFGTTAFGGGGGCSYYGCGLAFKVSTSGTEQVLYRFIGGGRYGDGDVPIGELINVNGILYGTTVAGGTSFFGTVYQLAPTGQEHVIYSFKGGE